MILRLGGCWSVYLQHKILLRNTTYSLAVVFTELNRLLHIR